MRKYILSVMLFLASFSFVEGSDQAVNDKSQSSSNGDTFYKEDFSGIEEGLIPSGWIGGNTIAVNSSKSKSGRNVLTNFTTGHSKTPHNFTIPDISFPEDWKFEIECVIYGGTSNSWSDYYEFKIGEIKIRFEDRIIQLNGIKTGKPVPSKGQISLIALEKSGSVLKLFVNSEKYYVIRVENMEPPRGISFTSPKEFDIYRLEGTELPSPDEKVVTKEVPATALNGDTFYKEDFSGFEEGLIPSGWIGGNTIAVNSSKSKKGRKVLTNFTTGTQKPPHNFTIPDIPFPEDWKFEIECVIYGGTSNSWSDYYEFKIGEIKIRFEDRIIQLNGIKTGKPVPSKGQISLVTLEKSGSVLKLFVNSEKYYVIRVENMEPPKGISFTTHKEFDIYRLEGTRLSSSDEKVVTKEVSATTNIVKSEIDSVDKAAKMKRPDGLAVIIGIEKYKDAPAAAYAKNDALTFEKYANNVLGIPEENIYTITDDEATLGEFMKLFGKNGYLKRRVTDQTDIFVYYSGHGAPDLKTKVPYLIPYDVDPDYPSTGYSTRTLYDNLGSLNAKSITVFLDACFSGATRSKEMLLANARPVRIEMEPSLIPENITLLTASSGAQISSGFPDKGHGLFSYFLMMGMTGISDANGDNKITYQELYDYIHINVKKTAGKLDREQTPLMFNGEKDQILVELE